MIVTHRSPLNTTEVAVMSESHLTVEYRAIPGFPGYRVGSDGSVWSERRLRGKGMGNGTESYLSGQWRQLKLTPGAGGYLTFGAYIRGKLRTTLVHRCVLLAFAGSCPEGMEGRHINGVNTDNCTANLCWGSHAENMQDKVRHGTSWRAERNPNTKLTPDDVRAIRALGAEGVHHRVIAARFHVRTYTIWSVLKRVTWAHVD